MTTTVRMDPPETDRLARLEREVAILRSEVARLRDDSRPQPESAPKRVMLGGSGVLWSPGTDDLAPPLSAPRRKPAPRPAEVSLEQVVGRYGTLAVATVTVLVAAGTFLGWAIRHGLLGPVPRVVLGFAGAAALGAIGLRLRLKGTREFGSALLALSLAVVHLVCWSAGPQLHVLPSVVALAIALASSVVLVEFSLRHEEELLCAVGFGGAAIAPFVTSTDSGRVIMLMAYGAIVISLSVAALGSRQWIVARRVTIAMFALYLASSAAGSLNDPMGLAGIAVRLPLLFPLVVLAAIVPLAHAIHRRLLVRIAAAGVIIGAFMRAIRGEDPWALGLTILAAVVALAALDVMSASGTQLATDGNASSDDGDHLIDAGVLPVGFFGAALMAAPDLASNLSGAIAILWTTAAAWASHRARGTRQADVYATVATFTALCVVPATLSDHSWLRIIGASIVGVGLAFAALRLDRLPYAIGAIVSLAIASAWSLIELALRAHYDYLPLLTPASALTAVAVSAWLAALWLVRSSGLLPLVERSERNSLASVVLVGASVTAFLWVRFELAWAWNATAATALLIVYYGAAGVFLIWLGRRRAVTALRLAGLSLTLWSAAKALIEAVHVPSVGVRVAVFLVISAFLISVGYWYRRGGTPDAEVIADGIAEDDGRVRSGSPA